jgi:hypothetical protein
MEFPRPELMQALYDCGVFIPLICGIPKESIGRAAMAGATFIYSSKGELCSIVLGAALVMKAGRIWDIKTPEMGLRVDNPDLEQSTMWEDRLTKQALVLQDEIIMYAEGKRAQTVLNFEREGNEHGQYGEESSAEAGEESE